MLNHRLWIFFWVEPFLSHLYEIYLSIKDLEIMAEFLLSQIFIYVHNNLFAPQASDFFEKSALIFLYRFHRDHNLLTLKIKKLWPENKVKNIKTRVKFILPSYLREAVWKCWWMKARHEVIGTLLAHPWDFGSREPTKSWQLQSHHFRTDSTYSHWGDKVVKTKQWCFFLKFIDLEILRKTLLILHR